VRLERSRAPTRPDTDRTTTHAPGRARSTRLRDRSSRRPPPQVAGPPMERQRTAAQAYSVRRARFPRRPRMKHERGCASFLRSRRARRQEMQARINDLRTAHRCGRTDPAVPIRRCSGTCCASVRRAYWDREGSDPLGVAVGFLVSVAIVAVPIAVMLWHLHRRGDKSSPFGGRPQNDPHRPAYREARFAERRKQWGPR
jgi:hypothetical protein